MTSAPRFVLAQPEAAPVYGPRDPQPSKLDVFKTYIEQRLKAGVWNARVLLRELRQRGYAGGYTILTDWLRPQRESARTVAVRRFETPIGHQAQVDWGHLGSMEIDGNPRQMWGFAFTLGYSRAMMAEAALDQTLGALLRMHEEAFRQWIPKTPRTEPGENDLHYCQRIYERGCQEKYLPVGRQPGHNDTVEAASPSFGLWEPMCQRSKNCNA